jgi:tripartite-type tricarboxylate transporter receptor subunit TctC
MNWMAFFGLVAPKDTSEPIVRRLSEALGQALASPDVREKLVAQQAVVTDSSPAAFKDEIERELKRMQDATAGAGIRLE